MKRQLRLIIGCYIFVLGPTLMGQVKFRNFSLEEGLSMSTIMSISQTTDGYMWFATPDKLNRFDGYEFVSFKHETGNPNTLTNNYVSALLALPDGTLLVGGHEGSIDLYNPVNEMFEHLSSGDASKDGAEIRSMILLDSHRVAIATMGSGLGILHLQTRHIEWLNTHNTLLVSDYIQDILLLNSQQLAIATDLGIMLFYTQLDSLVGPVWLPDRSVSSLAKRDEHLFAATHEQGLFQIHLKTNQTHKVILSINPESTAFQYLNVLLTDSHNNLWVGSTFDGIVKLGPNETKTYYKKASADPFSLVNNTVYSIKEDFAGNIWIGTISGLSVYIPVNQQFELYRPGIAPGTLSNKQVYFLYEDAQSQIWVGTLEGGVNRFNPQNRTFEAFTTENTSGLTTHSIRCIYQDKQGNYWLGTGNMGLFLFNPQKRKCMPLLNEYDEPITYFPIKALYEDSMGVLWIGADNGLFSYDAQKGEITAHNELFGRDFFRVMEMKPTGRPNRIWIATFGSGLIEFDTYQKKVVESYIFNDNNPQGINSNNVMCILPRGLDTLFIGTFGGGINILQTKTGHFSHITESDGLPNDAIYGILNPGNSGELWFSSNKGLASLNLNTMQVNAFDLIEQVQSLEFNEGAYLESSDGYLMFGGIEGINRFNPRNIFVNSIAPRVHVRGVRVFDKLFTPGLFRVIKLSYKQNYIGFEYVGLEYTNPLKVTYEYQLEGLDQDWVMAGTRRFAQYTGLKPGRYVFRVRARNSNGVLSYESAQVQFVIAPPIWLKPWFVFLSIIVLSGAIFAAYRTRTNQIRRAYQIQLNELEVRALRSQMNPHFIFNSINSIQYYILNKNPKLAYSYLAKFSSLMRKILQNSRKNFVPLAEEIQSLELYLDLENIRMDNELDFKIEVDSQCDTFQIALPSMILQPFVENAILHGLLNKKGHKLLHIRIVKERSHLYCTIEDNGIGREKAEELNKTRTQKHASTAIKATQERLQILSSKESGDYYFVFEDLYNSHNEPSCTRVTIFLPYKPV